MHCVLVREAESVATEWEKKNILGTLQPSSWGFNLLKHLNLHRGHRVFKSTELNSGLLSALCLTNQNAMCIREGHASLPPFFFLSLFSFFPFFLPLFLSQSLSTLTPPLYLSVSLCVVFSLPLSRSLSFSLSLSLVAGELTQCCGRDVTRVMKEPCWWALTRPWQTSSAVQRRAFEMRQGGREWWRWRRRRRREGEMEEDEGGGEEGWALEWIIMAWEERPTWPVFQWRLLQCHYSMKTYLFLTWAFMWDWKYGLNL